jgi:hypothetical protein
MIDFMIEISLFIIGIKLGFKIGLIGKEESEKEIKEIEDIEEDRQ